LLGGLPDRARGAALAFSSIDARAYVTSRAAEAASMGVGFFGASM
jgi:hypothetical protein